MRPLQDKSREPDCRVRPQRRAGRSTRHGDMQASEKSCTAILRSQANNECCWRAGRVKGSGRLVGVVWVVVMCSEWRWPWCTGTTGIPFRAEPFGWNLDRPALSDAKSDGAVAPASAFVVSSRRYIASSTMSAQQAASVNPSLP